MAKGETFAPISNAPASAGVHIAPPPTPQLPAETRGVPVIAPPVAERPVSDPVSKTLLDRERTLAGRNVGMSHCGNPFQRGLGEHRQP